jgi:protein disulfide-isomerase A6
LSRASLSLSRAQDGKYALARSAFELEHVKEFIERIRKGGESVLAINGELASIAANTPWNGKDAVVEDVEEFSLDDLEDDEEEAKEEL